VDAAGKRVWLVEAEARGQQRCLKQQHHKVLDRLVAFVGVRPLLELLGGEEGGQESEFQLVDSWRGVRKMGCPDVKQVSGEG
jgi:hypothetical protein